MIKCDDFYKVEAGQVTKVNEQSTILLCDNCSKPYKVVGCNFKIKSSCNSSLAEFVRTEFCRCEEQGGAVIQLFPGNTIEVTEE